MSVSSTKAMSVVDSEEVIAKLSMAKLENFRINRFCSIRVVDFAEKVFYAMPHSLTTIIFLNVKLLNITVSRLSLGEQS